MQELSPDKPLRHAMHIDVSIAREHAEARVAAALAAGGRFIDDGDAPAGWIVSDGAGNKVCIAAWPDGADPASPAGRAGLDSGAETPNAHGPARLGISVPSGRWVCHRLVPGSRRTVNPPSWQA